LKRVAFVVQRCGAEVNGGSEHLCLAIAQRMSAIWNVEVLTTRALDFLTWANHYPAGDEILGNVRIRRFSVDFERDTQEFGRMSEQIAPRVRSASTAEQEAWIRAQGPYSSELLAHLAELGSSYDAIIFFTYLYATTYFGLPLVADRAYLVPTAHDEWPIHLTIFDDFFARPKALVFCTDEERDFLSSRCGVPRLRGPVVGLAVEPAPGLDAESFRRRHRLFDPFLLYVGRVDGGKNCDVLIEYFLRLKRADPSPLKLVLIGRASLEIPEHPDIISLGFVDEEEKWSAIAACRALVMPSDLESLSIVLLEAWAAGRPVLINGANPVLVGQCRRANGGLAYESFAQFSVAADILGGSCGDTFGAAGSRYVRRSYTWASITATYDALITT